MEPCLPTSTVARRRFAVSLPEPSQQHRLAFGRFYALLRRQRRDSSRVVFGSGGAHGPVEIGGFVAVLGGWSDAETRAWLSERPRQLAGVSVGTIAAVGVALGLGPLRLAAMNYNFPYADVFGCDVLLPRCKTARELVQHLGIDGGDRRSPSWLRGLLGGVSLRTICHVLLVEAGCDDGLTFAQLRARTGHDVRVLATSLSDMRLVAFCAASTPHVRVCDAMVASMSIPGLFVPHRIPGHGDFVDGGLLDPFGLRAFEGMEPEPTIWLCKAPNLHPSRRSDSLMSVLLACMGSSSGDSLRRAWPPGNSPLRFHALFPGARKASDERDTGNSVNLFARPEVAAMICDGMECVEASALSAWMILLLSLSFWRACD